MGKELVSAGRVGCRSNAEMVASVPGAGDSAARPRREAHMHQVVANSSRLAVQRQRMQSTGAGGTVLQARWLIRQGGERVDVQDDGYQLQEGERWADEAHSHESGSGSSTEEHRQAESSESVSGHQEPHALDGDQQPPSDQTPPQVRELVTAVHAAQHTVLQIEDEAQSSDEQQAPQSNIAVEPSFGSEAVGLQHRGARTQGQQRDVERGEAEADEPRRDTWTIPRLVSGLAGPIIEIAGLLSAALGTLKEPTGLGWTFFIGAVVVVVSGLKSIADDLVKHERDRRGWAGRLGHTAGALTAPLMTIPMGLAGTTFGSGMSKDHAVWIPFVFGLIAIFVVHFIKLMKWIGRQ